MKILNSTNSSGCKWAMICIFFVVYSRQPKSKIYNFEKIKISYIVQYLLLVQHFQVAAVQPTLMYQSSKRLVIT